MKRYWIFALCLTVLLSACLLGCSPERDPAHSQPTVLQVENVEKITTPYAEFVLPAQWQQQLRCEAVMEDGLYTLRFYGRVPGREEQRLFDLIFGESSAYRLGTITKNGVETGVYVEAYDLTVDSSWTDGERNDIYAMQDLINTILEQLYARADFVGAP